MHRHHGDVAREGTPLVTRTAAPRRRSVQRFNRPAARCGRRRRRRRSTDPLDLFEDDPDSIEGRSTAPPRLSSAPAALAADDRHISLDELTFQHHRRLQHHPPRGRRTSSGRSRSRSPRPSATASSSGASRCARSRGSSTQILFGTSDTSHRPQRTASSWSTVRAAISTRRCEAARAARHPASRCASARASPPRSRTSTASA